MSTDKQDAKPEESQASSESSTEEQEQDTTQEETQENVSQDAKTQESDTQAKSWEDKYRDMVKAAQKEREKRKEVESQLKTKPESAESTDDDEEDRKAIQERFLKSEARATIAYLQAKDPTFNERLDLVEKIMEQDKVTVDEANDRAKAVLFDQMAKEAQSETPTPKAPNQLSPNAAPEAPPKKTTGSPLKDIEKGYMDVDPEMKEAIMRKIR